MDWSNELCLEFINTYESYSILWDPHHPEHKNRTKLTEAWLDLQAQFNPEIPLQEIKKKKDSLLASYRALRRKIFESESKGTEEVFKPSWFAFQALDRFLRNKGDKNPSVYSESVCFKQEYDEYDTLESVASDSDLLNEETTQTSTFFKSPLYHRKRRREITSSTMPQSSHLQQDSQYVTNCRPQLPGVCDIYGQYVTEQLTLLQPKTRIITQMKINNLLGEALLADIDSETTQSDSSCVYQPTG